MNDTTVRERRPAVRTSPVQGAEAIRQALIDGLESARRNAFDATNGAVKGHYGVGIVQVDEDTRMIVFEGESIMEWAKTIANSDIEWLIEQVRDLAVSR